jgi:hypothetical protein
LVRERRLPGAIDHPYVLDRYVFRIYGNIGSKLTDRLFALRQSQSDTRGSAEQCRYDAKKRRSFTIHAC